MHPRNRTSADPEAPGPLSKGLKVSSGQAEPLKCYSSPKIDIFGVFWASPTTDHDAVFDRENGRFTSRKHQYSQFTRKVGFDSRGSKGSPYYGKESLAPVQGNGTQAGSLGPTRQMRNSSLIRTSIQAHAGRTHSGPLRSTTRRI